MGVEFPVFARSDVVGEKTNTVFKHLKKMFGGRDVNANFEKFLIVDGVPVKRYPSEVHEVHIMRSVF